MTKEYKCLTCTHLKESKIELMECELQVVRYLKEDKSMWTYDPVCIHDDECESQNSQPSNDFYKEKQ